VIVDAVVNAGRIRLATRNGFVVQPPRADKPRAPPALDTASKLEIAGSSPVHTRRTPVNDSVNGALSLVCSAATALIALLPRMIRLGIAVANPVTWHPAVIAVDRDSAGRVLRPWCCAVEPFTR